ncbi:MAG: 23S rRNA (uracil(1939)-C(5))-methyltransferase RlmD [Candidatus Omnitrophota bacterium]
MQIKIEKIIYPGRSFAKENSKVIFTDEGIPGEIVKVKILKEKKNFIEAETQFVLNLSSARKKPRCLHYKVCSPYQYIDYEQQLQIKKEQIIEMFSHFLKIELPEIVIHSSPEILGYRNKIHLHITNNDQLSYAYHTPEYTNKFTEINSCSLASEQINNFLARLLSLLQKNSITYVKEVTVRENHHKSQMLVSLHGIFSKKQTQQLKQITAVLLSEFPLNGIICINSKAKTLKILHGKNIISEAVAAKDFSFGIQSFFQINIPLFKILIDDLKKSLILNGRETVIDLYSGVGIFAVIFAAWVKKVIAVEISEHNTNFLKYNVQANSLNNVFFYKSSCEKQKNMISKNNPDIIIVDPPRKGLSNVIIEQILLHPANYLVYVSCDPSTLTRDLKILLDKYSLEKIHAYDFFPQTTHIETLVILKKI